MAKNSDVSTPFVLDPNLRAIATRPLHLCSLPKRRHPDEHHCTVCEVSWRE